MILSRFVKNDPLSRHANFRIGGPAKYFFEAKSSDDIMRAVDWALQHGEQFFILGGGSNVLVSDQGFDGLVIKAANRSFNISPSTPHQSQGVGAGQANSGTKIVYAEAGVLSAFLARKTAEAGLTGFLWAISLPGTIGGAVRGNAGCFGGEIKDVVKNVFVFDIEKATTRNLQATSCKFAYRDSLFKRQIPPSVILSAQLELRAGDPKKCLAELDKNIAARKEKQPLYAASAGCVFKNFRFQISDFRFQAPEDFIKNKMIPAGWLIEKAGLKGLRLGGAQIAPQHGNFVVNIGNATASDVVGLIKKVKEGVFTKFGIELQEEIQYVGSF